MGNISAKRVNELGIELSGSSSLTSTEGPRGETVNLLVTKKKQPNYCKYCEGTKGAAEDPRWWGLQGASRCIDPVALCIDKKKRQIARGDIPEDSEEWVGVHRGVDERHITFKAYTDHETNWYAKINLALATDSPSLSRFGSYVRELREEILETPVVAMGDKQLFRGVDISPIEFQEMERLSHFFIPSFTSTSTSADKCYAKDTVFVIQQDFQARRAATMTEEFSKYAQAESEVLIACYTAFRLMRSEMVNKTRVVQLYIDDFNSSANILGPACEAASP